MLQVKDKKQHFSARPQSFADLMDMYEANYIRLRLLCGELSELENKTVSQLSAGGVPVQLSILERNAHTTLLELTYLFKDKTRRPDLKIQVYHDSRQADVISRNCHLTGSNMRVWEQQMDSVLLCRWRLNRFLFKWLSFLRFQGHHFN